MRCVQNLAEFENSDKVGAINEQRPVAHLATIHAKRGNMGQTLGNFRSLVMLATVLSVHGAASTGAYAENAWVQVRESIVRSKPMFFSSMVTPVRYGDAVGKLSEESGWARVSFKGKEGYLPSTTLTPARIVLSGRSSGKVMADASDVVLAGKGFSKEVEENYKRAGKGVRYDLVDRVEKQCRVNAAEVKAFVGQGGLNG